MLTHGGMPESEAFHWNKATYLRLGQIVCDLMSGDAARRAKGHNDYHNMHRYFMAAEWDAKINDLDIFRAANNHRTLKEMLSEISNEFVKYKAPVDALESSPAIPAWAEKPVVSGDDYWPEIRPDPPKPAPITVAVEPMVVLKTEDVMVEQLSLF